MILLPVPVFDFYQGDISKRIPTPEPPQDINVNVTLEAPTDEIPFVNASEHVPEYVKDWDSFIGQEPMKEQLLTHIQSSITRLKPLDHVLLASGNPGVGKTTLARLIAKELLANITMLVPPFSQKTLYSAALQMEHGDVLFIDEIHKLADGGPRGAENLLHMLDERTLYLADGVHHLEPFTVIGATTDPDKLPETVVDRFPIKPYFQPYTMAELVRITKNFADYFEINLLPETMVAIAKACRGTPRIARELTMAVRDIQITKNDFCTPGELLAFKEIEADGMTPLHKAYIKALYQFFGRESNEGRWEYIAGEASMMNLLRETKQGISRLERFLIQSGLIDRTPQGRRLTPKGIQRAQLYITKDRKLPTE